MPILARDPFYGFYRDLFNFEIISSFGESDIRETEKDFRITVDLPGVEKEDVKLKWKNNALSIEAIRNPGKKDSKKSGKFTKTYAFSQTVNQKIEANMKNGVLEIVVKKDKEQEFLIPIS